MSLQIAILYGSVREARQGIKAARFIDDQLCRRNTDMPGTLSVPPSRGAF